MTKLIFSLFRTIFFRLLILLILGLLTFEFYMYLSVARDRRMHREVKRIADYERVFCNLAMPKNRVINYNKECPTNGIVTSFVHGGFANIMWEYANVLAASVSTGLEGYISFCMKDILGRVFTNISIPPLSEIGHCILPLPDSVSCTEDWMESKQMTQSIVFQSNNLYGDYVLKYLNLVRDHFVFVTPLKDIAATFLQSAKRNRTADVTYIGVYITKTSIIVNQEYDDAFPSVQFFVDAVQYFRREYKNALFLVIADRKSFWEFTLKGTDMFIMDEDSLSYYGASLALLSHCNHTILSSQDIAVWGAILAGGRTVVSLSLSEDLNNLMQHLKDWTYLLNNTKTVNKFLDRLS